jgi:hypothetical protein
MIDDFKSPGKPSKLLPIKNHDISPSNKPVGANLDQITNDPKIDFTIDENLPEDKALYSKEPTDQSINETKSIKKLRLKLPKSKKAKAGLLILLIVIIGGAIFGLSSNHKKPKPVVHLAVVKPVSDLVASTLSGSPVAPSVNKQAVTGVMVENSLQARPQSGLSQAGVVFEALAEGGITRFLALYQDTAPSNVGPIRSVRPYYLQWALGFDASIAHVGGSPVALSDIKTWDVKDLNEFYNGSSYHRISSRQAPHNVYTSISDLNQLEAQKNYTSASFDGFPRKAAAPSKSPNAASISLSLSSADYNDSYAYDGQTNSYNRSEGGQPMIDANTNTQISPKVVIAIVVPLSQGALDSSNAYYSVYGVIGSGKAYIFQDGNVTPGTWTKSSNTSQIQFKDANGQTIALNPGQTWITAVSSSGQVSYTP